MRLLYSVYHPIFILVEFLSVGLGTASILEQMYIEYGKYSTCSVNNSRGIFDNCNFITNDGEVPAMTKCRLQNVDGTIQHVVCTNGQWHLQNDGSVTNPVKHRQKRGWLCDKLGWFCKRKETVINEVVNKPPTFPDDCATIKGTVIAEQGSTSAHLTWNKPAATDPENDPVTISQVGGDFSGSAFEEGSHNIVFMAEDSKGNKDFCFMPFTVTVIRCPPLDWPRNGRKNCDWNDNWGSTCTFVCDEGYEIQGSQSTTCEEDGRYSDASPSCTRVKCPTPDSPENGEAVCSRPDYSYSSICLSHCDYGYTESVFIFSECMVNKEWSNPLSTCDDFQPPRITCPSIIKAYTDRNSNTASVTWDTPIATDNSERDVKVDLLDSNYGPGSLFPVGYTPVSYQAVDDTGNISPTCTVMVIVETMGCAPPILTDNYLVTECQSDGLYQWGSSCRLSCLANLPLVGPDTITCERVNDTARAMWTWDWQEEPYCKKVNCPELKPPLNGALACDSGITMTMCNLMCNENYDVSPRVLADPLFACSSAEVWMPPVVPDCSVKRNPERMNLPSEIYYYSGDCGDESTNEEITNNFVARMDELKQSAKWEGICQEIACDVANIEVYCGENRKKRDAEFTHSKIRQFGKRNVEVTHIVTFMIIANVSGTSITRDFIDNTENALHELAGVMGDAVVSGEFNISGLELRHDSFSSAELTEWGCPYGQISEMTKFYDAFCVGCPVGTYYNGQDDCLSCPKGTYRDSEDDITCTECPEGTWTSHEGTVNSSLCKDICPVGSYSLTGLSPCSPCPVGEFQSNTMALNCIPCPPGKTTETESSTTDSECHDFDILMKINSSVYIDTLSATGTNDWAMTTWLYHTVSTGHIIMTFGEQMEIKYSVHSVVLTIQNSSLATSMHPATDRWVHLAVRSSMSSGSTSVFINGTLLTSSIMPTTSNLSVSPLELSYSGPQRTGAKISGFNFAASLLSDDDIQLLSSSCNGFHSNANITMSDLLRDANQNLDLIIPTECDEYDDCLDQPCGNNVCENELDGYACYCTGGFTGEHCEIPPDYCLGNKCGNGATCRSGDNNYTCDCLAGYSGEMCQYAPVNGQWSVWMDWRTCDVTCGGSTMTRQRFCDSPPPDEYGLDCEGHEEEQRECNVHTCPSCSNLERPYASLLRCDDTGGMTYCNLTCRDGYTFLPGHEPKQLYYCGIETNYEWQHTTNDNPLGDLPRCSKIGRPNYLYTETQVTYKDFSCSKEEDARDELMANLRGLPCVSNETCEMQALFNGCQQENRRRRNTGSVTLNVTFSIKIDDGNLNLVAFFENRTVSDTLAQIIEAINELQSSTQILQSDAHHFLDIHIEGITYQADSDIMTTTTGVGCPDGAVPVEAFCVGCTPGTFLSDGVCLSCEKGSYQDNFGQSTCIQCPAETTTPGKGAASLTYCKILQTTDETSILPTTVSMTTTLEQEEQNEDEAEQQVVQTTDETSVFPTTVSLTTTLEQEEQNEDEAEQQDSVLLIALLSIVGFIVGMTLVLSLYGIRYIIRKRSNKSSMGSVATLDMVRPHNTSMPMNSGYGNSFPPSYEEVVSYETPKKKI